MVMYLIIYDMDIKRKITQQRSDLAMLEFLKELSEPPFLIKEATYDEVKDANLECAKQNIDRSSLTDSEKEVAKKYVELFANDVAQKFKTTMKQSGKIV